MATVFVRGAGGALFEMDVPTAGHALERWEQALAKGDLTLIPLAVWEERVDGSRHLVVPTPEATEAAPAEPKPKGGKKLTPEATEAAPAEDTQPEE